MKNAVFIFILFAHLQIVNVFAQGEYMIKNVSVITMEFDSILQNTNVLISGGRIKLIDRKLRINSLGVTVIDGTKKYLMPGLADMHMHFFDDSTALRLYVAKGITTIRCMSGKPEYLKWRKEINEGKKIGPQLYCNGPMMNDVDFIASYMPLSPRFLFFGTNIIAFSIVSYALLRFFFRKRIKTNPKRTYIELGLPIICIGISYIITWFFWSTPQVAGEEVCLFAKNWEVRKAVQEQKKLGYNAIKPYVSMTRSEFIAMMEEANEQHIPVVGHIPSRVRIEDVLAYKMAGLAHIEELRYHFYRGYDFSGESIPYDKIDTMGLDKITHSLMETGIFVTSSLIPCKEILERMQNDSLYFLKPEMKYIYPKTIAFAKTNKNFHGYNEKEYSLLLNILKSCHKNNVLIVLGTDATVAHGFTVYDELNLMVENGFNPYEALITATKNAAISVNALNEWGTIAEGKRADLLLLDKNPLADIKNTNSIYGVFLSGKWYSKKKVESMLDDVYEYIHKNDKIISPLHKNGKIITPFPQ